MKIVKLGKRLQLPPVWRGTCSDCNSVIEAEDKEINTLMRVYDPQDGSYFAKVPCIACQPRNQLPTVILYEQRN